MLPIADTVEGRIDAQFLVGILFAAVIDELKVLTLGGKRIDALRGGRSHRIFGEELLSLKYLIV